MSKYSFESYIGVINYLHSEKDNEKKEDFIQFLLYSAERLNKGDSVQVIWNDYQQRAEKKYR